MNQPKISPLEECMKAINGGLDYFAGHPAEPTKVGIYLSNSALNYLNRACNSYPQAIELAEIVDAAFWIFEKGIIKLKEEGKGDYSINLKRLRERIDQFLKEQIISP